MECKEFNQLCKYMTKIRSSQAAIFVNSYTEWNKTQFFPVSIVKIIFESFKVIAVFLRAMNNCFLFLNCSNKLIQKHHSINWVIGKIFKNNLTYKLINSIFFQQPFKSFKCVFEIESLFPAADTINCFSFAWFA